MTDTPSLRERVARLFATEDDEEFGEHSWDAYLPLADAAISLCREEFAGVAEGMRDCEGYHEDPGSWNSACERISRRIRSEGVT